jgi:PAS domain S-box-containing protein
MSKQLSLNDYKALAEEAPIMMWRATTTAECDFFNNRWLMFRGRTMEEECGNQWTEGVHSDDLQRCLATYLRAFEKREPFEMEYRLRRHDGVFRSILDRGVPVFAENGDFQGYVGSCIDITDRIEAQKVLDQARERELANLRGILPICMHCKKIRQADGVWKQLERYIRDHSQADFSHGLCPACYDIYRSQVGTGEQLHSSVRVLTTSSAIADEELYRRVVEAVPEGIWIADPQGRTLFCTPRMAEILRTDVESLAQSSCFDYLFPGDLEEAQRQFGCALAGSRVPFDFRLRRTDGSAIWVSISCKATCDDAGNVVYLLGLFTDITERKRSEAASA